MPEGTYAMWLWGDSTDAVMGGAYTSWHIYRRTGTFTVTAVACCMTNLGDMYTLQHSGRSNACTIHILGSP